MELHQPRIGDLRVGEHESPEVGQLSYLLHARVGHLSVDEIQLLKMRHSMQMHQPRIAHISACERKALELAQPGHLTQGRISGLGLHEGDADNRVKRAHKLITDRTAQPSRTTSATYNPPSQALDFPNRRLLAVDG